MSYRIYLRSKVCDHCKRRDDGPCLPTPTFNLSAIFDLAFRGVTAFDSGALPSVYGLRILHGETGKSSIPDLKEALERTQDRVLLEKFVEREPANGFGTLCDAVDVLHDLLQAAEQYPDHVWEIQ